MKCIIMAGGFGTRLYPLTIGRAKALLEYKGKPLLTYLVDKVPREMDILVSINARFAADFRRWQQGVNREVEFCVEEERTDKEKRGAVSALNFWIEDKGITEDVLVLAGDNYFEFDLADFIAAYNGKNTLVAIYDIGDQRGASQFGVVTLQGYRIVQFEEKPANPASSLIATASYILPPRVFPNLAQYCSEGRRDNLGEFISYLITIDEVHAHTFAGPWFDIGSEPDKLT